MKVVCRDCGATFDDDLGWKECEACFANKIEAENYPPCPNCDTLRAEMEAKCFDNAQLRAEIEALRGKVRELDARLLELHDDASARGYQEAAEAFWRAKSELGLLEARDGE